MIQLDEEITKTMMYSFDFKMNYNALFPVYTMDLALKSKKFNELIKADIRFTLGFQNTKKATMFFPKGEWDKGAQYLLDNLQKKEFFQNMKEEIEETLHMMDALIDKYQKLENEDLEASKLVELYKYYLEKLVFFRAYAMLPNVLSLGNITVFDAYRKILSKKVSNEEYSILTTPKDMTDTSKAELEMLKLIRDNKTSDEDLEIWTKNWGYLYYYYLGPHPILADAIRIKKSLEENYSDVNERISEIESYGESVSLAKQKKKEEIGLTDEDMHLVEVISFFGIYKQQRKELMQKSYVALDHVFEKLSKITGMKVNDLKFLLVEELEELVEKENKEHFTAKIKKREKEFMFISTLKGVEITTDLEEIPKIKNSLQTINPTKKLIVAYVGEKVRGEMIIVNTIADIKKIEHKTDFILASGSTYPDLLPAMVKSKGIVTQVGGLTSHAGIVARELKKPCIVGYADLFKIFQEGDILELNTKEGTIVKVTD